MANQKSKTLSPVNIIRIFLLASSAAYLIGAIAAPDRGEMMSGLAQILMSPAQLTKDYFEIGSISGTFLNVALVGFVCAAMTCLPGAAVSGLTIAAYFLTTGFSFWGINFLNMWPFFLGVMVHALVRKEPFPKYVNLAMFATALCPLASELLLRYPGSEEVRGVTLGGVVLMLVVGMLIGFMTPAMAAHSPNVHKGYDLYSAALPGVAGCVWLMESFRAHAANPVLWDYAPLLLAIVCGMLFYMDFAGISAGAPRPRRLLWMAGMTLVLSAAALVSAVGNGWADALLLLSQMLGAAGVLWRLPPSLENLPKTKAKPLPGTLGEESIQEETTHE